MAVSRARRGEPPKSGGRAGGVCFEKESVSGPEGKQALRDPVAGCLTVVEQLEVYLLLADQIELAAVGVSSQICVLGFQGADSGAEFFYFTGIPEVNDQTDGFLFH